MSRGSPTGVEGCVLDEELEALGMWRFALRACTQILLRTNNGILPHKHIYRKDMQTSLSQYKEVVKNIAKLTEALLARG